MAAAAAKYFVEGPLVRESAQQLLDQFPLTSLFEALGNAQPADRVVIGDALERLAGFEDICATFLGSTDMPTYIRQGSASPDGRLRRLSAKLMEGLAKREAGSESLVDLGLVADLEILVLDEEVGISETAARTVCAIAAWPVCSRAIVGTGGADGNDGIVQRLQERMRSGGVPDTKRIRILHLFVELGRTSESDIFSKMEACGAFKDVLAAFLTDDILLKLNAVELMDCLGSYPAGQQVLGQQGVPEKLVQDLSDPYCDPSVRLCVTRLLGFVLVRVPAAVSTLLPSCQSPLAQSVATYLQSRDVSERLCGLNTFASISTHSQGLSLFLQWPEVLDTVISMVSSAQAEICKAAIATWAMVLNTRSLPTEGAAQELDVECWRLAQERVLPLALKCVTEKPFPDIRACTWRLMAVLVRSQDAGRRVLTSDAMRDTLLDFSSETASDAKIAKHEFVQALVKYQGSWLAGFLDENIEMILAEFAKQGPYWMPQVSAVSVADQNMS